jgi:hypothetical protein
MQSSYAPQYSRVRDSVLGMLGAAFDDSAGAADDAFLSFIGYPPVLDAIVTLLKADPNFHRIEKELEDRDSNDVEINLLHRIASYILRREKEQKVVPNIVASLITDIQSISRTR